MPRRRRKVEILETEKKNRPALESGFMGNPVGITMPDAVGLRGTAGRAFFAGKGKHSLWGWKLRSRILSKPRNNTARLNQMPGIQTKIARLSQMPGTRIKTARLSQMPEAQTGQSSPMLPQRKQKPLWCTSAEQYPLRGCMSFRQAAEL